MQCWGDLEGDGFASFEVDYDVGDLLKRSSNNEPIVAAAQEDPVVADHENAAASITQGEVDPESHEEAAAAENPNLKRNSEREGGEHNSLAKKARAGTTELTSVADFAAVLDWEMPEVELSSVKVNEDRVILLQEQSCNSELPSSSRAENKVQRLPYTIPGPAGRVQLGTSNSQTHESHELNPFAGLSQVDDSSDYKTRAWLKALQSFQAHPLTTISQIKSTSIDRVPQLIAIIKSCTPNGCGDAYVTLKDPTGTISGTIHRKLLAETEFGRDIVPEAVIILCKVTIFRPNVRNQYLNITIHNVAPVHCLKL